MHDYFYVVSGTVGEHGFDRTSEGQGCIEEFLSYPLTTLTNSKVPTTGYNNVRNSEST